MCRNIRTLFNFDPPATEEEIQASSVQYVRKISGYTKPSRANAEAFERAVEDVATVTRRLLDELVTTAPALAIYPGLLIFITVIAVNFLGDGMQHAFDPRSER